MMSGMPTKWIGLTSPILGISLPVPMADQLSKRMAFFSSSKTASLT